MVHDYLLGLTLLVSSTHKLWIPREVGLFKVHYVGCVYFLELYVNLKIQIY